MRTTEVVLDGRGFLESPHWHDGAIWTSDLHRHEVIAVSPDGSVSSMAVLEDQPSGLGFLPNGAAIVVSLLDRRVLRVSDLSVLADLAPLTVGGTNDMVVDEKGRAYVGSFGYDVFGRASRAPGNLVLVDSDGSTRVVAEDLYFPNGMALTTEGTLLVAESHASRITEFSREPDGSLSKGTLWAELPGRPDGMAIDAEGALWIALPREGKALRVRRGGVVVDAVVVRHGWRAVSCGLGGDDMRSLFLSTALVTEPTAVAAIEVTRVEVPGLQ